MTRMRHDRQRGFTMVETLVALVVLAIGLLGIAALYLDSLRAGRTAIYRTQAVNLSADLADRIRSNRGRASRLWHACARCRRRRPRLRRPAAPTRCATDLARWKGTVAQGDLADRRRPGRCRRRRSPGILRSRDHHPLDGGGPGRRPPHSS
jgi:type IV pilus modification protein PilV